MSDLFDYFKDLNGMQTMYFYIALFFTVLFILQSVFTFLDLGDSIDFDTDLDGDVDADFSGSFGFPFQLFTIRGFIGFFLLFGWSGLLLSKNGMNEALAFFIAFLCGLAMMVITGLLYYFVRKLNQSGNVNIKNAIGKKAEVYIPIPEHNTGTGKVSIILNNAWKELDAITYDEKLNSGDIVTVIDSLNDKLVVKKINKNEKENE